LCIIIEQPLRQALRFVKKIPNRTPQIFNPLTFSDLQTRFPKSGTFPASKYRFSHRKVPLFSPQSTAFPSPARKM